MRYSQIVKTFMMNGLPPKGIPVDTEIAKIWIDSETSQIWVEDTEGHTTTLITHQES